jgi:diaminopimelate epimerase
MQGCGNDFLIMDYIGDADPPRFSSREISFFCDRHFGIGADGLVLLKTAESERNLASWSFYNCDGSEAEMCGNAARCVVRFLSEKFEKQAEEGWGLVEFETAVGVIKGRITNEDMVEVTLFPSREVSLEYEELTLRVGTEPYRIYFINTGVPHAVIEVPKIHEFPVNQVGKALVKHSAFGPAGTNVTFFQQDIGQRIFSTTFERGVEEETLACGTGAAAAAIVYAQLYIQTLPIEVIVPGGTLFVDSSPVSKVILLRGPAEYVMSIELQDVTNEYRPAKFFGVDS